MAIQEVASMTFEKGEKRSDLPVPDALSEHVFAPRQCEPGGVGSVTALKRLPQSAPLGGG